MFIGSANGGKSAATIYRLVATRKLHDIDPFAYFRDVLERLPSHPITQLQDLLPHNWKPAQATTRENRPWIQDRTSTRRP